MKNKYYTPDITEFHSGFEYEIRFIDEDDNFKWAWQEFSYELDGSWKSTKEDLQEEIDCGRFRVKYLNREDIESLGFNNFKKTVCNWYRLEGKFADAYASYGYWSKIRLTHCPDNNSVKISAYEYSWEEDETVLFQGKIKNKSELKKLLTQLNIL